MNFGPSDGVLPVKIDSSVRFSSIGGLKEHIKCLREMIIFPLMYPELFKKFNTRPAKGVLFHGPPGTGKTLLARALANECSLVGGRKVSFFIRKGADVMNKYYGESERNLRTLFQTARKMKPSIIFFDEIDALAPARKSANENTHSSVVATLLAEMDGLCDRGDVVVIGATNRPDAMDPAVRRAGRFDRELYFPPPEADARRDILAIYTRDWEPRLSNDVLSHIANLTVGFLGSDIKSLCSEAVLKAVRRVYPQIYESDCKLLVNAKNVEITTEDMLAAMEDMVPAGARYAPMVARPLPPHTLPLLEAQVHASAVLLNRTFPPPSDKKCRAKADSTLAPSVFLVSGECAETLIAPALLAQLEHCIIKELSVPSLHAAHVYSPEQAVISLFSECRRTGRSCVIFVRDLLSVWTALDRKNGTEVLLQLWRLGSVGENTLLLATCKSNYDQLPKKLQEVFPVYKDCIYNVRNPTALEVMNFLNPVITELPLVPPIIYKYVPPPPLPLAPTGPRENEEDMIRRLFQEYDNLRVLRSSLKHILRNLSSDKRYYKFVTLVKPDVEPDYYDAIKNPMDLGTMSCKIDDKQYYCAKEFLDDIDLICSNALLYNKMKPDRKMQQDAYSLHRDAYSLVAEEIDVSLELECQLIARRRRDQGNDDDSEPDVWNHDFYLSKLASTGPDSADLNTSLRTSRQSNRKRHSSETRRRPAKKPKPMPKVYRRPHLEIKDVADKTEPEITTAKSSEDKDQNINNGETNAVIINSEELDNILKANSGPLCDIGLEAIIDLHAQLSKTVYGYSYAQDRSRLPQELHAIIARYMEHAHKYP